MDTLYRQPCQRFHRTVIAGRCPWCGANQIGTGPQVRMKGLEPRSSAALDWLVSRSRHAGTRRPVLWLVIGLLMLLVAWLAVIVTLVRQAWLLFGVALVVLAVVTVSPWLHRPRFPRIARRFRTVRT